MAHLELNICHLPFEKKQEEIIILMPELNNGLKASKELSLFEVSPPTQTTNPSHHLTLPLNRLPVDV
jgi:hypothetical protein